MNWEKNRSLEKYDRIIVDEPRKWKFERTRSRHATSFPDNWNQENTHPQDEWVVTVWWVNDDNGIF